MMKKRALAMLFVVVIWLATSLASCRALWRAWRAEVELCKDILRPQDKALSIALWQDPRYTVSAQCGKRGVFKDCRFCWWVRKLLGEPHCDAASEREIPEIRGVGT